MRTKDDHMKNGQLKPCYNVQFSTNNQIIVHYTTGQSSTDAILYQQHLESYQESYGSSPDVAVADAGYGSEENYDYLAQQEIEAFVKYSYFHKEQKRKYKQEIKHKANLYYNAEQDCYYCSMGQKMEKQYTRRSKTKTGYEQRMDVYQAKNCTACPLRGVCHKSKEHRKIYRNANLEAHKAKARQRLMSEVGVYHRGQRCVDVEGTFGQLKHNKDFRRFLLRGIEKVNTELGLLATSMNIAKLAHLNSFNGANGVVCPDSKNTPEMPLIEQQNALNSVPRS